MTITQRLKDSAALDSTYAKGFDLAVGGDVVSCEVDRGVAPDTVRVEGTVRGSYSSSYRASVVLDLAEDDVVSYSCGCPAHYSYAGMCKHAMALALRYLDDSGIEPLPPSAAGAGGYGEFGYDPYGGYGYGYGAGGMRGNPVRRARPSSPEVSRLIISITNEKLDRVDERVSAIRRRNEAVGEPADFSVTIMPAVTYTYSPHGASESVWLLKLRIHRGKASYVVKNMEQLVRAWRGGAEVTYGKSLSLAHTPANFTERARKVLALVERIVDAQHALFSSRYQYRDAGRGTEIKDLPLSGPDVIELLDLFVGERITFDPRERYGSRYDLRTGLVEYDKPRTLEVAVGNPTVEASIAAADDGGYDLVLPHGLDCFLGPGRLCVVDDHHAWLCDEEYARAATPVFSTLLPADKVHVSDGDLADFCRSALPALQACMRLAAPEALGELVPPAPELAFRIGLEDGVVFCDPTASYAGSETSVFDEPRPGGPSRDVVAEYQAIEAALAYFPNADVPPWFDEDDDERMYLLLTEGLRELGGLGEVLLSERLRGISVRTSPQVAVKATVRSGLLDLEVNASGLAPADLMAYLASYKKKQRYLRLSNGDIMRLDGSVRALADLADGLGIDEADLVGGAVGLPSNRTLFVDALLRRTEGVRLERNDAFRAVVRDFETFSDADIDVPPSLREVLRPYQEEGMRWLGTLERFGFGGILADDMGLGKTLQMIAHVLARKEAGAEGPTLIVCPASLVYNWTAELARFAPQLDAVAVAGDKARRRATIGGASGHDVLVTSYDLLKRDVEEYSGQWFARVVLDEAQYIKNAGTQAARACKRLDADVRFALTGTPIENRLSELWSIFDFLMPGLLGSPESFTKRFADAVEAREEGAARRLQAMVGPFVLRRLKGDVLADLPEKNESVVYAQMEGEQAKLYAANQDRLALQISHEMPEEFKRNKLQVLAELTRLRQICCDPRLAYDDYAGGSAKLDTCMELIRSALDGGHAVLLFSQFTSMLDIVSHRLAAEKVAHLVLTGATDKKERARLVASFQAGEAKVFLISLKAGGVGLNLTAADVVIHYDPWWNFAAQNQATDRAHRIGQERAVSVFKLIAKGTIEERIVEMQLSKRDLAESVLAGDQIATAAFDRDGVLELLGAAG